jgi:adenylyltransferase/sulfurtransferase
LPHDRYSRQTVFAEIGEEGQERLRRARVVVAGCGALGSVAAEMLARAGVGHLRIVDRDLVELSNLQRQALFTEEDVARALPKAVAAAEHLALVNHEVVVEPRVADIHAGTVDSLLEGSELVVDGTDNFDTRMLLNEACVRDGRPWVYAACIGSYAVCCGMRPGETACLRCFLEQVPGPGEVETCETAGILGAAVHAAAALEVGEAMRLLLGRPAGGILTSIDVWTGEGARVKVGGPRAECPVCGQRRYDRLERREGSEEAVLCGRDAVQVRTLREGRLDLESLAGRLAALGDVESNPFLLRFRAPEGRRLVCFEDGRVLVTGTRDTAEARSLVARYIGS